MAAQDWFLNAVAEVETELLPRQLLARCLTVERKLKRRRTVRNGPRNIDIDVLFYADAVIQTRDLELPHPRYRERRFVLRPLADLAPELRDPLTGHTVSELLRVLQGQELRAWTKGDLNSGWGRAYIVLTMNARNMYNPSGLDRSV